MKVTYVEAQLEFPKDGGVVIGAFSPASGGMAAQLSRAGFYTSDEVAIIRLSDLQNLIRKVEVAEALSVDAAQPRNIRVA